MGKSKQPHTGNLKFSLSSEKIRSLKFLEKDSGEVEGKGAVEMQSSGFES